MQPNKVRFGNAVIKVVGVGGGGGNAVNHMIDSGIKSAQFIAINTDLQDLNMSHAQVRIQIGDSLVHGLGAGADPAMGQKAAEESKRAISDAIKDADMVFIAAGLGGGTGTGAAPIVASIAKEMGKLTVAVVTKPFEFEGAVRMNNAEIGLVNLTKYVDTLLVIPNEKLLKVAPNLSITEAFNYADDVLSKAIRGISDIISTPALINLDFADVCTVMRNKGIAHIGIGHGAGERRTLDAVKNAVFSQLLDTSIEGATSVIVNVIASPDVPIREIKDAVGLVKEVAHPSVNLVFGADVNKSLKDEMIVTVIATGFDNAQRSSEHSVQSRFDGVSPVRNANIFSAHNEIPIQPNPYARNQNSAYGPQPVRHQNPPQQNPQGPARSNIGSSRVDYDDSLVQEFLRQMGDRDKRGN